MSVTKCNLIEPRNLSLPLKRSVSARVLAAHPSHLDRLTKPQLSHIKSEETQHLQELLLLVLT